MFIEPCTYFTFQPLKLEYATEVYVLVSYHTYMYDHLQVQFKPKYIYSRQFPIFATISNIRDNFAYSRQYCIDSPTLTIVITKCVNHIPNSMIDWQKVDFLLI